MTHRDGKIVLLILGGVESADQETCILGVLGSGAIQIGRVLTEAPFPVLLSLQRGVEGLREVIYGLGEYLIVGLHGFEKSAVVVVSHSLLGCPCHSIVVLRHSERVHGFSTNIGNILNPFRWLALIDHLKPIKLLCSSLVVTSPADVFFIVGS